MKRLLGLIALIGLNAGCYIGETYTPIMIASVREVQSEPDGELCADDLVGLVSASTSVGALASAGGGTPGGLSRTFFFTTEARDISYGFTAPYDNVNGQSLNTFIIERLVFDYETELGLPSESTSTWFNAGENSSDGCLVTAVIGDQAATTLGQLAIADPVLINVRMHFEGRYVNGKEDKTNTIDYPLTVFP